MTKDEAIKKVVDVAMSQVGYLEKRNSDARYLDDFKANAGKGNCTKYHRDLDNPQYFNTKKMGAEWCAIFVHWVFWKNFGMSAAQKMLYCGAKSSAAGCWLGARYFRNAGAFYKAPQVGDQIFFGKAEDEEHTGIVVKISGGRVYTVEGNADNAVREKNYKLTDPYISGYGRPKWDVVANGKPEIRTCSVTLEVIQMGSTGKQVATMQQLLISKWGISCGRAGADGVFGDDTKAALQTFQKRMGYKRVDCICGAITWADLLKR